MVSPTIGAAARETRAAALDSWLSGLLPTGLDAGMALIAVGGLGRRECAPYSDLDLVLLHDGRPEADDVGSRIWYAVWDARYSLDHSIRSLDQALAVSATDLKAALGILDARLVLGDQELFAKLRSEMLSRWQQEARQRLPQLRELTRERWKAHGELAFLLEGDVKESRGGLRDFGVLRGLGFAGVADSARPAVRAAHRFLLDVRDAMHVVRGRRIDRLLAQDRSEVARVMGLADGDTVLRRIVESARTTAHAVDDAWRTADRRIAGRSRNGVRWPIGRDVVEQNGEAVLARRAVTPKPDPSLALRVAAAAARRNIPIARPTLEWLSSFVTPLPTPWPPAARDALLTLLGSGQALVSTWEDCDRYGLTTSWLPEFARIRSLPQYNPVHRFTVDRHLVEATLRASDLTREVDRPDLLLLAALLHDIGKGLPGSHSEVGAPIAAAMAARIGLSPEDVETIERVVRWHLLLPDTATRRDLEDPVTIRTVADAAGNRSTLALLHALARADAAATGPAAWSLWKGRLVSDLVRRVDRALNTGVVPEPVPLSIPMGVEPGQLPVIEVAVDRVEVIATDRLGLLAAVAGCLALHRLEVLAADTVTLDGISRLSCAVQPRYSGELDLAMIRADLKRAVVGELDVAGKMSARGRNASPWTRTVATSGPPRAVWHPATGAIILELRAADSTGLLYRVARALSEAGADVRSARISTLGGDVVDAFYLVGEWEDLGRRKLIEDTVVSAVEDRADTLSGGAESRRPRQ